MAVYRPSFVHRDYICRQQVRVEGSPKEGPRALLSGNPSPPATVSGAVLRRLRAAGGTGVPEHGGAPTFASWITCPGKADAMHRQTVLRTAPRELLKRTKQPHLPAVRGEHVPGSLPDPNTRLRLSRLPE